MKLKILSDELHEKIYIGHSKKTELAHYRRNEFFTENQLR